jgi:hypothetical protein
MAKCATASCPRQSCGQLPCAMCVFRLRPACVVCVVLFEIAVGGGAGMTRVSDAPGAAPDNRRTVHTHALTMNTLISFWRGEMDTNHALQRHGPHTIATSIDQSHQLRHTTTPRNKTYRAKATRKRQRKTTESSRAMPFTKITAEARQQMPGGVSSGRVSVHDSASS